MIVIIYLKRRHLNSAFYAQEPSSLLQIIAKSDLCIIALERKEKQKKEKEREEWVAITAS
jgi:hypothetical protein